MSTWHKIVFCWMLLSRKSLGDLEWRFMLGKGRDGLSTPRWVVSVQIFYWKFTENIQILFVLTCIIIQTGFQESNARSTSLLIYLKIMIMYWYTMYGCSDMRQTLFCVEWYLLKNVGVGGKADVFSNLSFLFKTILSKQCSKENFVLRFRKHFTLYLKMICTV